MSICVYVCMYECMNVCIFSQISGDLTYAPLGYSPERAPLRGGADFAPCLTQKRVVIARWARRQMKALDEYFLSKVYFFL